MVYKGANDLLTPQEVMEHEAAFDGAAYCLLQTELNIEIVRTVVRLAHRKGEDPAETSRCGRTGR